MAETLVMELRMISISYTTSVEAMQAYIQTQVIILAVFMLV